MPEIVAGEFQSTCAQEWEEFGIDVRISGGHAGGQQGLVERHGGLLEDIWNEVACAFHIKGRQQAKMALDVCMQAKNASNSDTVPCHLGIDGVRTSTGMVHTFNECGRFASTLCFGK